ncbi:hypothetical protein XH88_08485 [Bradyrhizobium sp. CCBAU 51627]|nr:hypothetical protein [Bradyrhizobium sp. CCBAU 51627]
MRWVAATWCRNMLNRSGAKNMLDVNGLYLIPKAERGRFPRALGKFFEIRSRHADHIEFSKERARERDKLNAKHKPSGFRLAFDKSVVLEGCKSSRNCTCMFS